MTNAAERIDLEDEAEWLHSMSDRDLFNYYCGFAQHEGVRGIWNQHFETYLKLAMEELRYRRLCGLWPANDS